METYLRVLLLVALAFTMLDIVYSGRAAAGRSLVYTGIFITLALAFHFGTGVFSERYAE